MLTLLVLYALLLLAWSAFPLRKGIAFVAGLMADAEPAAEAQVRG
jgi:hypothetical protein